MKAHLRQTITGTGTTLYLRMAEYKHKAAEDKNNLYQSIKEIFKKPKPAMPKTENLKSAKPAGIKGRKKGSQELLLSCLISPPCEK